MLNARPMRRYCTPGYPTQLMAKESPDLLRRHIPRTWRSRAGMAAALAVCLSTATIAQAQDQQAASNAEPAADGTRQAPAGQRCMVITVGTSSDYVSTSYEEDALNLIKSVLRKSGVKLKDRSPAASELDAIVVWSAVEGKIEIGTASNQIREFALDGFDPKRKVGVRVVKVPEVFRSELRLVSPEAKESTASRANDKVAGKGSPVYVGVFDDSISTFDCDASWREKHRQRTEAKRLLRQQVQDFVQWLKAQGVI